MASTLLTPTQDQRLPEASWLGVADQALCARAGTGDLQAFAALYDRQERRVFSLCLAITADPEQASEATQEAFLALLDRARRSPDFPGERFRTLLLEAARDASVETLQNGHGSPLEELPEPIPARFTPEREKDDAERAARGSDRDDQVLAAIALLPVDKREVLALRELEQCSDDEIAEITVIDPNTVPQLIGDAGVQLRDQLRDRAPAPEPVQGEPAEIGLAYGALRGLAPIPALRRSTLARACGPIAGPAGAPEDGSSAAGRGLMRIPPVAATGLILLLGLAYSGVSGVVAGGPGGDTGVDTGIGSGFLSPLNPNPSEAGSVDEPATSTPAQSDSGQPPAAGNDQPGNGKPPAKGKPDPSGQGPPDPTPPPPPDPPPPPPPDPPPPPPPDPQPGPIPPIFPPGLFGP